MAVEIDQLLADWKNKVKVANQNLLELQELPTYQRLCGSTGFPGRRLTGITAARVTPAMEAVNQLFQYFDLLVQTVDQATKLRQQMPRFLPKEQKIGFLMVGQKITEIIQLLTGASIELPAVQTPLAQRELLTGAQKVNAITPALLLEVMTDAFSVARDTLLAVEAAWTNLDLMLINAEAQIDSLQHLAESLGQGSLNELFNLVHDCFLARCIEQDPLGTSGVIKQIKPLLAQVKVALEQEAKQHNQI